MKKEKKIIKKNKQRIKKRIKNENNKNRALAKVFKYLLSELLLIRL
jgi:hypothetical protein